MAKTKTNKAELQRRKKQASQDKKKGKAMVTRAGGRKPAKKSAGVPASIPGYAKLVLDPCNATFGQSNMPGATGTQQIRLPFRQILSTTTSTKNILGGTITSGTDANTLLGVLTPHAMRSGGIGPNTFSFRAQPNETTAFTTAGQMGSPYFTWGDPTGLAAVNGFAGEMRPVAACIRITCLGSDIENQGMFFGYEGAAKSFITHSDADFTKPFLPQGSAQDIIFNGQNTGDTYKTYEVRINYPNAAPQWQDWRQVDTPLTTTGVIESGDAGDQVYSEMPIAIVGVTSAKPGVNYLFDGAIVYEWQPKTISGIVGPKKVPADPGALAKAAKVVQSIANSWGGMLISTASDFATGGNASAALGLLRRGYATYTARNTRQPLLLGM